MSDAFRAFHNAYEERVAQAYGEWRPVVPQVADKFLECGVLNTASRACGARRARISICSRSNAAGGRGKFLSPCRPAEKNFQGAIAIASLASV